MKKIILISLLLTFSAFAENLMSIETNSDDQISIQEVESLISNQARCAAETICPNMRRIYCYAVGFNCTFYVLPGRAIRCTGYNPFNGQWVNFVQRCY